MKILILIFSSILLFPIISFAQLSKKAIRERKKFRDKYIFAVKTSSREFKDTVNFLNPQVTNKIVIIPIQINGKTYNFIFDTGAITIISNELKEELNLSSNNILPVSDGANNSQNEHIYTIKKLTIGKTEFTNVGAIASNIKPLSNAICTKIDGIIGTNIMRTCFWSVDYLTNRLYFSNNKTLNYNPDLTFDFEENFSGVPNLKMQLGKYNFKAIWDSGDNGYLSLADSLFFNSGKPNENKLVKGQGITTITLYKANIQTEYLASVDSIYFDNTLFKNETVSILPENSVVASIGNKFMKQFQVMTLNWKNHKIYLKKRPEQIDSSLFIDYGIKMNTDSGICKVVFLWNNSPAQNEGIQLGDTIVSINGKSVRNISKENWCSLRSTLKEKTSLQLQISRSGKIKSYDIKKYNFFQRQ